MIIVLATRLDPARYEEYRSYVCVVDKEEEALTLIPDLIVKSDSTGTKEDLAETRHNRGLPITDEQRALLCDSYKPLSPERRVWTTQCIGEAVPMYTAPTVICTDYYHG